MRQRLPKWREVLLMLVGGAVAALLFWLVTGKGAEAPFASTAILAGVLIGSFPYAMRVKKLEAAEK
jgi:hypothetical protein